MSLLYRHGFQVTFDEVDLAAISFFSNAYVYAHRAYEAMMLGTEISEFFTGESYIVPFVHTECDHRAPMRHAERCEVEVHLEGFGTSSMRLRFAILGEDGGTRAEVRTVNVFVDPQNFQKIDIPPHVRAAVEGLQESA